MSDSKAWTTEKSVKESAIEPQPPSAHPSSIRTLETPELLDIVVSQGYSGPAWNELQRRFVTRALPNLSNAIATGAIHGRCASAGKSISRRTELQAHPYPDEIASESIELCLDRFRDRVLPEGQWNTEKDVSLEDFFVVCCLSDVVNRWRWYLRRLRNDESLDEVQETQILPFPTTATSDPAPIIEYRDAVFGLLKSMTPDDQCALALLADGWSSEEIAQHLGLTLDALYAHTSRARKIANIRRDS